MSPLRPNADSLLPIGTIFHLEQLDVQDGEQNKT